MLLIIIDMNETRQKIISVSGVIYDQLKSNAKRGELFLITLNGRTAQNLKKKTEIVTKWRRGLAVAAIQPKNDEQST
jgi:hypothetical protein